MTSLLLCGGRLIDGTGAPARNADVLVEAGRVRLIADRLPATAAEEVLDVEGLVVTPGFIDVHSHADNAPLLDRDDTSKLSQGVTTEVTGNCGFSLAPASPEHRDDLAALNGRVFPPIDVAWDTTAAWYAAADAAGHVTNAAPLVGHGALRVAAMGLADRPATADEMQHMRAGLAEALAAGAFGLSSGLIYPPGTFTPTSELTTLVADLPAGRIYTTHVRGEGRRLLASVEEAVAVAEAAGARLQVSHLKAVGAEQWGTVAEALARLDAAHARGLVVHHDVYPYRAASTMLASCLPPWFHEGEARAVLDRLEDGAALARAEHELGRDDGTWENWVAACGWPSIVVAATRSHRHKGEDLQRIAVARGVTPFRALVDLLREEDLQASMVVHAMAEVDVRAALAHPRAMVGSDGLPPGRGGKPHPRAWGTFPRVLANYVREDPLLTLPEAIRRMTSLPARAFGIPDRGILTPGAVADVVVLDPTTVSDRATYEQPERPAVGIRAVVLGGTLALRDGRPTGVRAGRRLRPGTAP